MRCQASRASPVVLNEKPALTLVHSDTRGRREWDPLELSPRLLRCFVTGAEELHFGRAAEALYVAQPALSRSIQQLERMLGRQLLVRTTRSVQLTSSAHSLLPPAIDRSTARHYRKSAAITDCKEFPRRSHFTIGQDGWEEVADYALGWALEHAGTPAAA